ncbi:MAG: hypothetical protein NC452_08335 [Eubacterium sp.]|nr:hypothetical protein [Eubacterium sp.]
MMIIKYDFADGTSSEVEVDDEIGAAIEEIERLDDNLSHKEHYHCLSIDVFLYEGVEMTTGESVETFLKKESERKQLRKKIDATFDKLSEKQQQRLSMRINGLKLREIAEFEQVEINAVSKSISSAKKNFKKFFQNGCKKGG